MKLLCLLLLSLGLHAAPDDIFTDIGDNDVAALKKPDVTVRDRRGNLDRSRAPEFQPYFESGFPYGHDQWISASATAWATMALAQAM